MKSVAKQVIHPTFGLLLSLAIVGCASFDKVSPRVLSNIDEGSKSTNVAMSGFGERRQGDLAYVGGSLIKREPVKAEEIKLPAFFEDQIELGFDTPVTISTLAGEISKITNLRVRISPDIDGSGTTGGATPVATPTSSPGVAGATGVSQQNVFTPASKKKISVTGNFTLSQLLDSIVAELGITWGYENGEIIFFRNETKIWYVYLQPGDIKTTSSIGKSSAAGSGATANISSSFDTSVSTWTLLEQTISSMLTSGGKLAANQAMGTLMVSDTPRVVHAVDAYIRSVNKTMTRQVAIKVRVLSVQSNDNSEQGVDWNLVWNRLSALKPNYSVTFAGAPSGVNPGFGSLAVAMIAPTGGIPGPWDGSSVAIKALNTYAKTYVLNEPVLMTTNNQPVPLAVTTQTTYISGTTAGTAAVGGTAGAVGITQSQLTVGFVMSITPKIMDDDNILMQFSLDMSTLNKMGSVLSAGQTLQQPEVGGTQITHRIKVRSGTTMVLSGYKVKNDRANKSSGLMGFGTQGAAAEQELAIIITPIIQD